MTYTIQQVKLIRGQIDRIADSKQRKEILLSLGVYSQTDQVAKTHKWTDRATLKGLPRLLLDAIYTFDRACCRGNADDISDAGADLVHNWSAAKAEVFGHRTYQGERPPWE